MADFEGKSVLLERIHLLYTRRGVDDTGLTFMHRYSFRYILFVPRLNITNVVKPYRRPAQPA